MDCIFCKIVSREIPAEIVYENDAIVAFMDIKPSSPGHVLVVPKHHSDSTLVAPPEDLHRLAEAAAHVARGALRATGAPAFNMVANTGKEAGQVVMHTHWHIIPRFAGDQAVHWAHTGQSAEEIKAIADKMRADM